METRKLGRYEIIAEIGRGAMGVVYKATDPMLNRTVAIKTINMSLDQAERAEYEARFNQEAKAAGGLSHPNIVTVHDIGNSGTVAYLAMELLEGEELRALLGDGRRLPVMQAIDIAAQVADGLAYAHGRGVVHRDIKPANIMVPREGPVKIMDFGIARIRTAAVQTQTGKLMGSPKYMSPEQVVGKRADPRSDIFSLGIILYEMLTGAPPFAGESVNALMYQTVNFIPPAPSVTTPGIPEMLDYIVAKMLVKKLDERYQNTKDIAADLRECARQISLGVARVPAAPGAGPTPNLADTAEVKVLLTQHLQHSRQADATPDEVTDTVPTFGISRAFDSTEATQKLAVQTGLADASVDAYATTVKLSQPDVAPVKRTVPEAAVVRQGAAAWWRNWSRREVLILSASALAGLVVATVIVVI